MKPEMHAGDSRSTADQLPKPHLASRARALARLMTVALAPFLAGAAQAQEIGIGESHSPPLDQTRNANGVDPYSGLFTLQNTDLSVGTGEFPSRIDLTRIQSGNKAGVTFNIDGRVICNCGQYTVHHGRPPFNFHPSNWPVIDVVLLGSTYQFERSSGKIVNKRLDGATLEQDADDRRFTFRSREGVVAYFDFVTSMTCGYISAGGVTSASMASCVQLRYLEMPNGESLSYRYITRPSANYQEFPVALVSEVVNSRGYGIRFSYEDIHDPQVVTSASAFRSSCVEHDTVLCTTGDLATVSYIYDRWSPNGLPPYSGRLRKFVDANGAVTSYAYDINSRHVATERRAGASTDAFTNVFDNFGKVLSQADGAGKVTRFEYSERINKNTFDTKVTDPVGNVTRYSFMLENPYPIAIEDGTGARTEYTYDYRGYRLTSIKNPEGDSIENKLDDRGNILERRHKAKPTSGLPDIVETALYPSCTSSNFRFCNRPVSAKNSRGGVQVTRHDAEHGGAAIRFDAIRADGRRAATRTRYASFSPAEGSSAPSLPGAADILQRDVILPVGQDACLARSPPGQFEFICSDENLIRVDYNYMPSTAGSRSSHELKEVVRDPNGAAEATRYYYDRVGNITAVEGARAGDLTIQVPDRMRRIVSSTGPSAEGVSQRAQSTYDSEGRQTAISYSFQGGWLSETVEYDARGLQVQSTGIDAASTRFDYDDAGRNIGTRKRVDGIERTSRMTLDGVGRVLSVRNGVGTPLEQKTLEVQYSPNGQPILQIDAEGNYTALCYDGFDRLRERRYLGKYYASARSCSVEMEGFPRETYAYNGKGDVASITLRDGRKIGYTFDADGRLLKKDVPEADRSVAYTYDLLGRRLSAELPGENSALSVYWTYDKLGRLSGSTGPFGRSVGYGYGPDQSWSEVRWPDGSGVRYNFDQLGRVSSIDEAAGASLARFTYDEISRRTGATFARNGTRTEVEYKADQRISLLMHDLVGEDQDIGFGYAFNEDGQLRSRAVTQPRFAMAPIVRGKVEWAAHELNQYRSWKSENSSWQDLEHDAAGNLQADSIGNPSRSFTYDAEGRLVAAGDSRLDYDAIGRLARITEGRVSRQFLYNDWELIGEFDETNGNMLQKIVFGPKGDEPIVIYQGGQRSWLYADERGSIVARAGEDGRLQATARYDPWGQQVGEGIGRLGYTGQLWLPEIGLLHLRSRMYSPALGRFIQPDQVGTVGGMNLYAYANNDPINLFDPLGFSGQPSVTTFPGMVVKPPPTLPAQNGGLDFGGINNTLIDKIQFALDIGGLVPVYGEPLDLVNAGIYLGRGQYTNAVLSAIAVVPVIGSGATVVKFGKKTLGNPFKGKTPAQIDAMFRAKGFSARGPDPVGGKGGYVNPSTGRSYHIDPEVQVFRAGTEMPHVDVNRAKGYDGMLEKKKYPLGDELHVKP